MSKLTQSILAQIKEQKITPRARAWFQTKNALVWGLVILAIVLAGVTLAALIRELLEAEWQIAARWPGGGLRFMRETISLLWLMGIFSALAIGLASFRQTRHGYRHGVLAIGGVILVASLTLAASLMPTGIPQGMRDFREQKLQISPFDERQWLDPAAGFLIGKIQQTEDTLLVLDALDHTVWQVGIRDADIAPMVNLIVGEGIRALGKQTGDTTFEAEFIMPRKPKHACPDCRPLKKLLNERNSKLPAYQMLQAR